MKRWMIALLVLPLAAFGLAGARAGGPGWLLNTQVSDAGPAPGQAAIFGAKNRGQFTFLIEHPDPSNIGSDGIRTAFQIEKTPKLAGTSPGRYALSYVFLSGTMRAFDIGGWKSPDPIGVIEVGPDEVIYIGDIAVQPDGMALRVVVSDHFEEFRAKLPAGIKARIQKRLIQLPSTIAFSTRSLQRVER